MWRVDTAVGRTKVLMAGPEGRFIFRVQRGSITPEIYAALKGMQLPALRRQVPEGFKLSIPKNHREFRNVGDNRLYVLLHPPRRAVVELKLITPGTTISRQLEWALRDSIELRVEPGTTAARYAEAGAAGGRRGGATKKRQARERKENAA